MRILPIQFTRLGTYKTNQKYNTTSLPLINQSLKVDTVSFKRSAGNAEKLRKLFKFGMIDMYTGQPLIDPDFLTKILQEKVFSASVKSVIKTLEPIEDCLHPVEYAVLKKIKSLSVNYPYYRLDDAIKKLAPKAQKKLRSIQMPIFKSLEKLAEKMPTEQKEAFDELMNNTYNQLFDKPIPYKFSDKEFKYKLKRIFDGIKQRKIKEEIKTMNNLQKMAEELPYSPSGRNFARRFPKLNLNKSMHQAEIIRKMNSFWERSCLRNDKELNDLFTNAKMQILNIPIIIPFKRRSFIHELKAITNTLKDVGLAKEFEKTVSKLPTSQKEESAFILKSSKNSSEKIGHDLLVGSIGTIEHLVPFSDNGGDQLENYAFTSTAMNSMRGNKPLAQWIRETPKAYIGAQKMVDRIIQLRNSKKEEKFIDWYLVCFANKIRKLSPHENPIMIDLSGIRC